MDREALLRQTKVEAMAKTRAAREAARRKRQKNSPARHISVVWKESMIDRFGIGVHVSPWGGKEMSLITKMVKELGADKVEEIVKAFISGWKHSTDFPTVGLLWALRGKIANQMTGVVGSAAAKIALGEYDEAVAAADPKDGWGNVFDDEQDDGEFLTNASDPEPEVVEKLPDSMMMSDPEPEPEEPEPELEPEPTSKKKRRKAKKRGG